MSNYAYLFTLVIAYFVEHVFSATRFFGLFMRIFEGMISNGDFSLHVYYRFVILSECLCNCLTI